MAPSPPTDVRLGIVLEGAFCEKQKMYLDRLFALRKENARENGGLHGIPIDKVGICITITDKPIKTI